MLRSGDVLGVGGVQRLHQRVRYVNHQQFRFYTAAGAKLARQADGLDQESRDRESSQLR